MEELFAIVKYKDGEHHVFYLSNHNEWAPQDVVCANDHIIKTKKIDDNFEVRRSLRVLTSAEVRTRATELRNSNKAVCGVCMSHMFSDAVD